VANGQNGAVVRLIHTVFAAGTVAGQSDGQLLARFATRGEDAAELAFSALVERHGPMVLRVCRGILRDEHDAQDAFQATFLVLARKAGSLWARDSLGPWLYGVAFRTASCARSAEIVRREHERRAAGLTTRVVVAEENWDDLGWVLHEEISRLPERYRRPILLCYFEGLTHDQAASQLNWPVGTVRSRLARARERLRTRLTRRGVAPDPAYLHVVSFRLGSLPAYLIDPMVKAAMQLAVRKAVGAGLVSASAAALSEGVLRTMFVSELKATAATLLAVGVIASGVGLYGRRAPDLGTKPATSALPSAKPVVRGRSAEDLDALAKQIEQLVRRARQEQAEGDIEGAVRDLNRVELGASQWRKALTNLRGSKDDTLPSARPLPAENAPPADGATLSVGPPMPTERLTLRPEARTQSPGASKPGTAEHRLDELERKVERILVALEKDARQNALHRSLAGQDNKPAAPPPPALGGRVTKVDSLIGRVEINIGSDDGLVRGHELTIYRDDPSKRSLAGPVYLGRIRILRTDPDQAVGEVIEWTGEAAFKEGNLVLSRTPLIEGERAPSRP